MYKTLNMIGQHFVDRVIRDNRGEVPITAESFANLMEPGVREVFFNSYDDVVKKESMVPRLFRMLGSTRQNEYTLSISAMGDFEDFDSTGQVTYDDISEGYKKTFTHNAWTKGIRITRKAKQNDLNNRGRNLAICWDEPKAPFTDKVKIKEMLQCANQQERLWSCN